MTESSVQSNTPKRPRLDGESTTNQWQSASSVVPTGMQPLESIFLTND